MDFLISSMISSLGIDISSPLVTGTIQNVHPLSQPIEILTIALNGLVLKSPKL